MRHPVGVTAFFILLVIAGLAWWLIRAHRPEVAPAQPVALDAQGVEFRLNKVRIRGLSGGVITWEIEADNFDIEKRSPVLRMNGLRNISVLNGKKRELSLSANTLERNTYTGDITLQGQVTVTGDKLLLRTPTVRWDAHRELLVFPRLAAQIGDYLMNTDGNVTYNVTEATLRCDGSILLTTKGNTLRAGGAVINLKTQAFTLSNPVAAELDVADLISWAGGQPLPVIPPIPTAVQERYREYCNNQEVRRPNYLQRPSPIKGERP